MITVDDADELAAEDEVGERVLDQALDRTAQRSCPHRRVVALLDEQLSGIVGELDDRSVFRHLLADALHQQVDDLEDLRALELVEDDDLVDAVQELRPEDLLELRHDPLLHLVAERPSSSPIENPRVWFLEICAAPRFEVMITIVLRKSTFRPGRP